MTEKSARKKIGTAAYMMHGLQYYAALCVGSNQKPSSKQHQGGI